MSLPAVCLIALLTVINLRGVRESGRALAVPVYAFLGSLAVLVGVGAYQWLTGSLDQAASASYELSALAGYEALSALAIAVLLLRSFASGTVALTGVQGVSNGVPALRRPKGRTAQSILVLMAAISVTVLMSVILLAGATGIQMAFTPEEQLRVDGAPCPPTSSRTRSSGSCRRPSSGPARWACCWSRSAPG